MDVCVLLGLYAVAVLSIIFILLCAHNPLFRNTPLPKLHYALTQGLCDTLETALTRCCGHRGTSLCAAAGECCCERSNPSVQILFLTLLGGGYWLFWEYVFAMLPLPGAPAWHRYTGTAAALLCLALFLTASFSDPGTVTAANVAAHRALHPPDGLLYEEKQCCTCGLPRPARSKHCSACGRCVSRLDHHCIWLNNCVGLLNMRWFLAFLLVTAMLCTYAAALGWRVIASDMALHDTWSTAFIHPKTGQVIYLSDSWRYLLHYLSSVYAPQLALTFFCSAAAWIVGGFTGYQLYLVCRGLTTVEVHKRHVAAAARELEAEAAAVEERVARRLAGGGCGEPSSGANGGVRAAAEGSREGTGAGDAQQPPPQQQQQEGMQQPRDRHRQKRPPELPNRYDRGVRQNLSEALFPHWHLRQAAAAAAAQAVADDTSRAGGSSKKRS